MGGEARRGVMQGRMGRRRREKIRKCPSERAIKVCKWLAKEDGNQRERGQRVGSKMLGSNVRDLLG